MMVTLALRNLTKILAGVCLVLVASIGYAKTSETPEVGAIGQIKGSGVLERGKDIVIDGNVGVAVRPNGRSSNSKWYYAYHSLMTRE